MYQPYLREFGHFIYIVISKIFLQVLIFFVKFIQEQQVERKLYYLQPTQRL